MLMPLYVALARASRIRRTLSSHNAAITSQREYMSFINSSSAWAWFRVVPPGSFTILLMSEESTSKKTLVRSPFGVVIGGGMPIGSRMISTGGSRVVRSPVEPAVILGAATD